MNSKAANISIRKINPDEIAWINAKYDEVGFVHSDAHAELIAVAEMDGERVGLGRLVPVSATEFELGGMYVFEAFRKHGLAGQIVEFLLAHTNSEHIVFCLPFVHLRTFYEKFGFQDCGLITNLKVPEPVLIKHKWCNQTYDHETLLLVRLSS